MMVSISSLLSFSIRFNNSLPSILFLTRFNLRKLQPNLGTEYDVLFYISSLFTNVPLNEIIDICAGFCIAAP